MGELVVNGSNLEFLKGDDGKFIRDQNGDRVRERLPHRRYLATARAPHHCSAFGNFNSKLVLDLNDVHLLTDVRNSEWCRAHHDVAAQVPNKYWKKENKAFNKCSRHTRYLNDVTEACGDGKEVHFVNGDNAPYWYVRGG